MIVTFSLSMVKSKKLRSPRTARQYSAINDFGKIKFTFLQFFQLKPTEYNPIDSKSLTQTINGSSSPMNFLDETKTFQNWINSNMYCKISIHESYKPSSTIKNINPSRNIQEKRW